MREILFRGKRAKGDWYFGSYLYLDVPAHDWKGDVRGKSEPVHYIIDEKDVNYAVDPKTVGQFTGLTDKNGKKIFEGDIVQAHFRSNHSKQLFRVIFDDGMFLFDNNYVKVPKYEIYSMEVIGNIHDNPELLGGAENG